MTDMTYSKFLSTACPQTLAAAMDPVDEYVTKQIDYANLQYAEFFATLSDELLAAGLARIDEDIAGLPYRSLTVNIADRGAGLVDERRRFVAEQERRALGSYGKRVA